LRRAHVIDHMPCRSESTIAIATPVLKKMMIAPKGARRQTRKAQQDAANDQRKAGREMVLASACGERGKAACKNRGDCRSAGDKKTVGPERYCGREVAAQIPCRMWAPGRFKSLLLMARLLQSCGLEKGVVALRLRCIGHRERSNRIVERL
jgi:hypothetical protein